MSRTASRDAHPGAGVSLADLFRRGQDLESFRRSVLKLEGRFPFSSADMIELGMAYLERFPDREQDRNAEEVRLGYAIVRTAIAEKAVLAVAVLSGDDLLDLVVGDDICSPEAVNRLLGVSHNE